MFLRLIRTQGSTDRRQQDNAEKIFLERFLPRVKEATGYAGFLLAIDRASGAGASVTYWQDAAAEAASAPSAELMKQAEQALGVVITDVDTFELALIERAQPPIAGSFMRTNDLTGDPARTDAGIAFARERVYPAVRDLPGFRALSVSTNRTTGRTILGTTWDSIEALDRSEAAVVDLREEGAKAGAATAVKVEKWEVAAVEVVAAAGLPS